MKRFLRSVRRALRHSLQGVLSGFVPPGNEPLPNLEALRKVLLVFVNFRIGNNLLVTPAVEALTAAAPAARFDLLGGPLAPVLFRGFRLEAVRAVRRSHLYFPARVFGLLRAVRGESYDAAIHLGGSAGSLGAFLTGCSGAARRIGRRSRRGNLYFTTALEPPAARHKVDQILLYAKALGARGRGERRIILDEAEGAFAEGFLRERGLSGPAPVGIFVGARERKGKGWDLSNFARVAEGLRAAGRRPVVFIGPEEAAAADAIRERIGPAVFVQEPDLRKVAAIAGRCAAVLTPDAGPMHLAIAAGAPTLAVFRKPNHDKWGPRPPQGEAYLDEAGTGAEGALSALLRLLGA